MVECQTEDGKRKDQEYLQNLLDDKNYYERGFFRGFLNIKRYGLFFLSGISICCVLIWVIYGIDMIDF
ncbi:MAG: hypothetical protein HOJ14_07305 [Nitrospina sp.]|nr:hypothetical protein [Nitrospina sp.]